MNNVIKERSKFQSEDSTNETKLFNVLIWKKKKFVMFFFFCLCRTFGFQRLNLLRSKFELKFSACDDFSPEEICGYPDFLFFQSEPPGVHL